jgi:hypothetical protein
MDTSILNGIASGLCDCRPERRENAKRFGADLYAKGVIPVICFENLVEMLRHADEKVVEARINMFTSMPMLAYVNSLRYAGRIGSAVDILAREVRELLRDKTNDAEHIARFAKTDMFRFCDGKKITSYLCETVDVLQPIIWNDQDRHRCLASISHLDIMGIGHKKVNSVDPKMLIDSNMIRRHGAELRRSLESGLRKHGVKNLNHDAFADGFASHCEADLHAQIGTNGSRTAEELMNEWYETRGIDRSQIHRNTTVADIAKMAGFNHKLAVASRALGLADAVTINEVPASRCPSEIVWSGLDERRRSAATRAESGDLYDAHLACLACYCDLLVVDKRTRTYLDQVCLKNEIARRLVCRVVSLSDYTEFLSTAS